MIFRCQFATNYSALRDNHCDGESPCWFFAKKCSFFVLTLGAKISSKLEIQAELRSEDGWLLRENSPITPESV